MAVAVGVGLALPEAEVIPQMDSAKTKSPLDEPIRTCFKYSNFGFSLLKATPLRQLPQVYPRNSNQPRLGI